ncbi:hypothetical protein OAH12_03050 [Cyclobacteriaceae bacterium]|nr:hypothetical protein [Cyclobacteriaceae bacterium]
MRQIFHISLILALAFTVQSCMIERYKGNGDYKRTKKEKKNDNYLQSEAGKVVDKSEKRNKKEEKKKLAEAKAAKEAEIAKSDAAKKKKKKRNDGKFRFY